jgi:hypothetical protein
MELRKFIATTIREYLNEQQEVLLAPNGNKSNLSKNLYNYVRTDEFKKWFGDWENNPNSSSKIVDENGEPMLVFHGTENTFQDFDRKELRLNYFYFAKKQDYASRFGENVKGCFLNARKIKDAKEVGTDNITIPKLFKILGFKTERLEHQHLYGQKRIKDKFWQYLKYYDEIYNNLKWKGYDCVNFFEDYTEDGYDETEVFAVFNSNQIKCVG